jgi:succinoglycan biosynthesis protein ExoM
VQAQADMAAAAGFGSGVEINYLHAPGRNISLARNAALAASDARYLAFLDDDEVAEPGWLLRSGRGASRSGAEVVLGPVDPVYPEDAPGLDAGRSVHATRPVHVRGEIRTGYTCNVLIDRARPEIRPCASIPDWAEAAARTAIISRVVLMGGRIDYAPDALVTEPVARERLSFSWLARAALPDGSDPCGRPAPPSRRVALARGSGGHGQALACACMALIFAGDRGWRASRRCAGCFMPASWPAWSVARAR